MNGFGVDCVVAWVLCAVCFDVGCVVAAVWWVVAVVGGVVPGVVRADDVEPTVWVVVTCVVELLVDAVVVALVYGAIVLITDVYGWVVGLIGHG